MLAMIYYLSHNQAPPLPFSVRSKVIYPYANTPSHRVIIIIMTDLEMINK